MTARFSYEHGQEFPYDRPDEDYEHARPAEDWAHKAARGVLADLTDRRGVKNGFSRVDEDTRIEIVDQMAEIIRIAQQEGD